MPPIIATQLGKFQLYDYENALSFPSKEHPVSSSSKTLQITPQEGKLMRKPAASERARFLVEESELRTQADFLAGKIRGLTNQLG
jgi:hypothetical protein